MRRIKDRLSSTRRGAPPAQRAVPAPPSVDTSPSWRGTAGLHDRGNTRQPSTRRPLFALAAAASGALAVVAATVLLLADQQVTVGPNVFVNPPAPIDAHNSPAIARNPRDADNLVVVNRIDRPRFNAALHWSADGGRVWRSTALSLPAGLDRPYAPDAAFGPDGTLYVTYVNLTGPGNVPANLWLARSNDGGRTLTAPLRVAGPLSFQARLAVDPHGVIYITYLQASNVGPLQLVGSAPIVAVRSTDGGRTFSEPVMVSDRERPRVGAATPVVDSGGELIVVYQDFKDDVRDFQNLEGPRWERPFALVAARSEDRGRTFSRGLEFESDIVPTQRFLVFLPEFPSVAAGSDGSLVVAWSDGRHGDSDVFLRRSPDGGRSWTAAVRVNNNARGDDTTQQLPVAAVAPGGRIDVVFLDRRRDPRDVRADAFLATSSDGASRFANIRLSSAAFDTGVGPKVAPHLPVDLGSRLGLVSGDSGGVAVWTDTRQGREATGRQDIVAAEIEFRRSAARQLWWALLAGGLLASAASLAGWWLQPAAQRREGRWPTDPAPPRWGVEGGR